ncbi:MAG: hypothetical protein II843_03950 [Alphaproteobacteria bacterium]|nr:hypothetical protein [Alphaproteobacteria bacterium]
MKRFISVLSSLLVLPAFAEVAPVYQDNVVEYTDDATKTGDVSEQKSTGQRVNINRSTSASRAISSGTNTSSRANTASRAVASSPRTATTETSRGTVARTATKTPAVTTRTAQTATRSTVTSRNAQNAKPVTARVGVYNSQVMSGDRTAGGITVIPASGTTALYNPSGSSRIGIANRRASARISTPVAPATTTTTVTQEDVTSTTSNLTNIAELTEYCKSQYAACMDNYCNILDDNQGRCSCSKNIKNYERTEQTLAQATEDFQNVVQQIRYIGLTSDQIEALFTETEAELSMKSNTDSSRLKNNLDNIKKKIVDVSTPSAASSVTNGLSLDMNGLLTADFSAGFDLNAFLNLNNNAANSVSNQRGEQLYKTAANRCKTAVLNSCTVQGIDANIITNAYDLEIDKQCVLYERSLNDANAEMKQNVTNATTILQQARLLLAQNKNSYDLRGCIAAIDSCMQDEYICGTDYELCLDPTGKYLANGEIVKGGTPGVSGGQPKTTDIMCATGCTTAPTGYSGTTGYGYDQTGWDDTGYNTNYDNNNLTQYCDDGCVSKDAWVSEGMYNMYSIWDYTDGGTKNAWGMGEGETLGGYIDTNLETWKKEYSKSENKTYTNNMALYLLQKIGYIDSNDKVHGMCASVLKQCQDYAFSTRKTKKTYIPANEVVRQYLNNTLAKIKMQQDAIIADYAEGCRNDVTSCLATNGYDDTAPNSTATKTAINACAAEITTCMSVGGYQITDGVKLTLRAMSDWVASIMLTCPENQYLADDGVGHVYCAQCPSAPVIVDMNQAANYPDAPYANPGANSQYVQSYGGNSAVSLVSAGGRISSCTCPEGYVDVSSKGDCSIKLDGTASLSCAVPNSAVAANIHKGDKLCLDATVRCVYTVNGTAGVCGTSQQDAEQRAAQ